MRAFLSDGSIAGPLFTFYGGKFRAAPRYPKPVHDVIVEPFAGGAGYSLRYADRDVILIERDPIIADLWRYLISTPSSEILDLPDVPIDGSVDDLPPMPSGARSLIGWWLNKGTAGPCRTPSAWMRACARGEFGGKVRLDTFWGSAVREALAARVARIRHWKVIEGDYTAAPDVEATWFVDPPYQGAGKHYRYSTIDYAHLGEWVRTRRGQVMVCENAGATWLPFVPHLTLKANESRSGGKTSEEVLWTNRFASFASVFTSSD